MIRVIYHREYAPGLRRVLSVEFKTMRAARRFISTFSPCRHRTDIHGNKVKDSHPKLVN